MTQAFAFRSLRLTILVGQSNVVKLSCASCCRLFDKSIRSMASATIKNLSSDHGSCQATENKPGGPLVQYVLVRTDLSWGTGALIAQACHASTASIATTLNSQTTKDYLEDLENMHKIILRADKLEDLIKVEAKLKEAKVAHQLWIEKPENIATCLAVSPQPKSIVQDIFRHFKLLK